MSENAKLIKEADKFVATSLARPPAISLVRRLRDAFAKAKAEITELKTQLVELEASIAGIMMEPGATVKPYVIDNALKSWRARQVATGAKEDTGV